MHPVYLDDTQLALLAQQVAGVERHWEQGEVCTLELLDPGEGSSLQVLLCSQLLLREQAQEGARGSLISTASQLPGQPPQRKM